MCKVFFLSPTIKIRDQILAPLLPLQLVKHAVAFSQIVRPNFSTFRGPKRQTSSQHWVNFHSWRCFLTCVWRPIGEDWSADVDRRLYKGNTHSLPERHSISQAVRCDLQTLAAMASPLLPLLVLLLGGCCCSIAHGADAQRYLYVEPISLKPSETCSGPKGKMS